MTALLWILPLLAALVCVYWDLVDVRKWPVRPPSRAAADADPAVANREVHGPVDVIVPVFNDMDTLPTTIAALERYCRPDDRIWIVDDGSTDPRTERILADLATHVTGVVRCAHKGKHAAVAAGVRAGIAPIICIVDADTVVPPGFLTQLLPLFEDADTEAVDVIPQVANPNESLWTQLANFERGLLAARPTSFGALFAIRRETYLAAPMRDCRSPQFELDLRLKASGRLRFSPCPVVHSMEPATLGATFRRKRRWVLGMLEGLALNQLPIPNTLWLCPLEILLFLSAVRAPVDASALLGPLLLLGAWCVKSLWLARRYQLSRRVALAYPLFMLVIACAASDALLRFRVGVSAPWR